MNAITFSVCIECLFKFQTKRNSINKYLVNMRTEKKNFVVINISIPETT
jgi:hypothetical protein